MLLQKRFQRLAVIGLGALLVGCAGEVPSIDSATEAPAIHPERWPELQSPIAPDPELEAAISELLGAMTLEDKVGQILQPEINSVTPEEVREYRLGSVLNGGGGWPNTNKDSTPADWLALADAYWEASMDTSEGGQAIPILWGLDAVHGHNNVIGATLFPHNVGLGAANNPELIREIGRVTATEVAVTGQDWDFGPTIAVARDGRWGRAYESYSEDPEIVAAYARAMVEGLQGPVGTEQFLDDRHLIATAKHFLGDGGTERGVDQGDNVGSEEELRDVHGAGYVTSLDAGVQTVMASFNSWHGRKMHGYGELLTDVLKEQMGFDGFIVGDWNGHGQIPGCSNKSCAASINAGLDMFMVPNDWKGLYKNTLKQVESGEIPMERLDDAVRRILRVKMRAGLFERGKPSSRPLGGRMDHFGSDEHRAVARQAVRESLVLLKNNGGLLPLDPSQRILVAGDGADDIGKQSGGWTITWQGTGNSNDDFPGATSIYAGVRELVERAGGRAELSPDGSYDERPDVAIVVFGEDPYAEFQGDRDTVDYRPEEDLELLRRLKQDGVPVVAVFITGRPLWVNPELNASDAFVVAWLPGSEGDGVAQVLLKTEEGEIRHDFKGRLPFSWPKSPAQAVLNEGASDYDPLFALGYGMNYAESADMEDLPEDPGDIAIVSRTVYFEGGAVPPWRLFVGDDANPRIAAESGITTTQGSDKLTLEAVDRRRQEDARAVRWSGEGAAFVYLQANEPVDLTREANGEMAVAFDAYVEQPAASMVTMSVRCPDGGCAGEVDITDVLSEQPTGEWVTIAVRLRCFEENGADMASVGVPFGLTSDGALALRFSDVRLVSGSEGGGGMSVSAARRHRSRGRFAT